MAPHIFKRSLFDSGYPLAELKPPFEGYGRVADNLARRWYVSDHEMARMGSNEAVFAIFMAESEALKLFSEVFAHVSHQRRSSLISFYRLL